MKFEFTVEDDEAQEFCEAIVLEMIRLYGLSEPEAVARMNRHWHGQTVPGYQQVTYHEEPTFWAQTIFHGGQIPSDEDLRFR